MKQWAKIIDRKTKEVQIGVGQDSEYYMMIGMQEMDVDLSYDGRWYVAGYAPKEPVPSQEEVIKEQIIQLENQITPRNLRSAIFGDEFAINKISSIESQINELRKQLGY